MRSCGDVQGASAMAAGTAASGGAMVASPLAHTSELCSAWQGRTCGIMACHAVLGDKVEMLADRQTPQQAAKGA